MSQSKSRYVLLCQQLLAVGAVAALAAPATGVASLDIVGPAPLRAVHPDDDEVTVSVPSLRNGRWSDWGAVEYHDGHEPTPESR